MAGQPSIKWRQWMHTLSEIVVRSCRHKVTNLSTLVAKTESPGWKIYPTSCRAAISVIEMQYTILRFTFNESRRPSSQWYSKGYVSGLNLVMD